MESREALNEVYRQMVHWGIPFCLVATIHYLQQISKRLNEISIRLSAIITQADGHSKKLDEHDRRIEKLEDRD